MGFFDKLKAFGSKVVRGIRKGWDFVKQKVAPVVRKVLPFVGPAATAIGTAFGRPDIGLKAGQVASKVGDVMGKFGM